jgi:hypothetical protein
MFHLPAGFVLLMPGEVNHRARDHKPRAVAFRRDSGTVQGSLRTREGRMQHQGATVDGGPG